MEPTGPRVSPSLVGRLSMLLTPLKPRGAARGAMLIALAAVLVAISAMVAGTMFMTRRIDAETRRIAASGASPQVTRLEAEATARAFGQPTLVETLAALGAHLPEGVLLVGAARGKDGMLRLIIDSADPDSLRRAFANDPWLARFRVRSEDGRDDGRLRVTLEEAGS